MSVTKSLTQSLVDSTFSVKFSASTVNTLEAENLVRGKCRKTAGRYVRIKETRPQKIFRLFVQLLSSFRFDSMIIMNC